MELGFNELDAVLKDPERLHELVAGRVQESEFIDYKVSADGYFLSKKNGKVEFSKDVASFANHKGGFIVIGVDEEKKTGLATEIRGIGDAPKISETLLNWLTADGIIDPPIRGVTIADLPAPGGRSVLVVRIPVRPLGTWHVLRVSGSERIVVREHRRTRDLTPVEAELHRSRDPSAGFPPELPPQLEALSRWIPNLLTFSRPPLACVAGVLAIQGDLQSSFWFYYAALWTDVLDGMVARAIKATTERGKEYDRVADIACNTIAGLGLLLGWGIIRSHPAVVAAIAGILALMGISAIWVRGSSIAAKVRSGIIRVVLVIIYVGLFPSGRGAPAGAAILLGIIGGLYEGVVSVQEYKQGKRSLWGDRSGK